MKQSFMTGEASAFKQYSRLFVRTTTTLTAPFTGKMLLRLAGGGASGARPPAGGNGTGGGSSEHVYDEVDVNAGDTITITPGAGGAQVSTVGANGMDGGDTTVTTSAGYSVTAKGAGGGRQAASGPVAGGLGGTNGAGGTSRAIRIPGEDGGSITGAGNTSKNTGGAAWNVFGLPPGALRGGQITQNDATARASSGAGVGGRGGDITTSAATTTYGGGAGGPGADNTAVGGPNYLGENSTSAPTGLDLSGIAMLPFSYFGGAGSTNGGDGAGGSAGTAGSSYGGRLAGGGGSQTGVGGAGGWAGGGGAGGGGGGAGGQGFVDVQFVRSL
jgi:hypothetical protein